MQFPGQYQTTFTIPTGATTGARIVLNGVTGTIQVYNSSNQLVDTIGGVAGAIVAGLSTGPNFEFNEPNPGVLTTIDNNGHITAQWDTGAATFTMLDNSQLKFIQLTGSIIYWGEISAAGVLPTAAEINQASDIVSFTSNVGSSLLISSPLTTKDVTINDAVDFLLNSGVDGGSAGNTRPSIHINDANGTTGVDMFMGGALISYANGVSLPSETWHAPALNAGFTNHNCQYRLEPLDVVHWQGEYAMTAAQAGAGSTTIFTLPAGYIPKKELIVPASIRNSGGLALNTQCFMAFETNGTVMLGWSAATPAGALFSCDVQVALNNIP